MALLCPWMMLGGDGGGKSCCPSLLAVLMRHLMGLSWAETSRKHWVC